VTLLIASFLAGVLTVLAPCILPLLPVIVGGSIAAADERKWYRPLIITGSLAASIILFTLLLKSTTVLLGIPTWFWSTISGIIVLLFGLSLLFPNLWLKLMVKTRLNLRSDALLTKSYEKQGIKQDILIGAALGPVFSSCSPTYALIVAAVLPQSFAQGLAYLAAYALGLALMLLLISFAGQAFARRLALSSDPDGWFMRGLGGLLIIVGLAVTFGLDRQFQTFVLDQGWYDGIMHLDERLQR
jgi:cytochrome c-type biogenesis protein